MAIRQKPTAVKNPTPFVITDPKGIDEIITNLQIAFSNKLPWLTKSFGKATKGYHEERISNEQTVDVFFPAIWIDKDKDPLMLLGSDNFGAYTFSYITGPAEGIDLEAVVSTEYQRGLSVIFWVNFHQIDRDKNYPFFEELIEEISQVIETTIFSGGNAVQILDYTTDPEEIFAEWSVELVRDQFLIFPHGGIRFNLNAHYHLEVDCQPRLLPPTDFQVTNVLDVSFDASVKSHSDGEETGFQWEISDDGGQTFTVSGTTGTDVTDFTYTGLTEGTSYLPRVKALGGNTEYLVGPVVQTDSELIAPTGLNITDLLDETLTLNWTNLNDNNEDENKIEISINSAPYVDFGTAPTGAVFFNAGGLTGGTNYSFRVTAIGSGTFADSDPSIPVDTTTKTKLPTPSNQTITNIMPDQMTLNWDSNIVDINDVEEVELTITGGISLTINLPANTETYDLTGLDPLTEYLFSVKNIAKVASDSIDSLSSPTVGADTIMITAPDAPTYASIAETTMTLNWVSNSGGLEDGFKILRSTDNVSFTEVGDVGSGITTFGAAGLTQGIQYYFKVVAYIGSNEAESSSSSQYTKLEATTTPSSSSASTDSITVTWSNPTGGQADSIDLWYRAPTVGGPWVSVSLSGTSTSHILTGLLPNVNYQFYTQRIGVSGQPSSDNSGTGSRTTTGYGSPTISVWQNDKSPAENVEIAISSLTSPLNRYYIWVSRFSNGPWSYVTARTSTSTYSFDPRSYGAVSGQPLYARVAYGVSGSSQNYPASSYRISSSITYS